MPFVAMFKQVPLPDNLHSMQPSVQAVAQQTPLAQCPLEQLVLSVHVSPLPSLSPHVCLVRLQMTPPAHSESCWQLFRQAAVGPHM